MHVVLTSLLQRLFLPAYSAKASAHSSSTPHLFMLKSHLYSRISLVKILSSKIGWKPMNENICYRRRMERQLLLNRRGMRSDR